MRAVKTSCGRLVRAPRRRSWTGNREKDMYLLIENAIYTGRHISTLATTSSARQLTRMMLKRSSIFNIPSFPHSPFPTNRYPLALPSTIPPPTTYYRIHHYPQPRLHQPRNHQHPHPLPIPAHKIRMHEHMMRRILRCLVALGRPFMDVIAETPD